MLFCISHGMQDLPTVHGLDNELHLGTMPQKPRWPFFTSRKSIYTYWRHSVKETHTNAIWHKLMRSKVSTAADNTVPRACPWPDENLSTRILNALERLGWPRKNCQANSSLRFRVSLYHFDCTCQSAISVYQIFINETGRDANHGRKAELKI